MQIYEVKNNIAEILYAPVENNLFLSDFIYIEDSISTIVAQVMSISSTENEKYNIATVKFELSVDKSNRLTRYNGHAPSKNSEVGYIDAKEIFRLFNPTYNGIFWGKYAKNEEIDICTGTKFLSSGCNVVCDKTEQKYAAVETITNSLTKNNIRFLLIDFDGSYKSINTENSANYGEKFRIPLDSIALDYIFENDLEDCPLDAKVIIQGIILELQKYIEAGKDGFIPFETFVNIIMAETSSSKNSGLMIFCNKLLKYRQKKIFADKKEHFSAIKENKNSFKIDVSQIDEKHYPLIFKSIVNLIPNKAYVISDVTNENCDLSLLKYIYEKQNIRLIPVLSYDNPLLNKIKTQCSNTVLFNPETKQTLDSAYSSLVEKLNRDECVLYGENTLFIPVMVSLKELFKKIQNEKYLNTEEDVSFEDLDDLDRINIEAAKELILEEKRNEITEDDLDMLDEYVFSVQNNSSEQEMQETKAEIPLQEETDTEETIIACNSNIIHENKEEIEEETEITTVKEEVVPKETTPISTNEDFFTANNKKAEKTTPEEDLIIKKKQDLEDKQAELETLFPKEDYEEPIPFISSQDLSGLNGETPVKKADKTIIKQAEEETAAVPEPIAEPAPVEEISQTQLTEKELEDGIIEYTDDTEEAQNFTPEEIVVPEETVAATPEPINPEPQQEEIPTNQYSENIQPSQTTEEPVPQQNIPQARPAQTVREQQEIPRKNVPNPDELKIYEPKEAPHKNQTDFQEGDRVSHAKHGNGTVEKIIKYGKKTLCSIQFDNVGRRLLDPNITVLEKI